MASAGQLSIKEHAHSPSFAQRLTLRHSRPLDRLRGFNKASAA